MQPERDGQDAERRFLFRVGGGQAGYSD